jgi:hypothetical protein
VDGLRWLAGGLMVGALAGCHRQLAVLSAGPVGCRDDDIAISDEDRSGGSHTWTATCEGRRYTCSQEQNGDVLEVRGSDVHAYGQVTRVRCAPEGSVIGLAPDPSGASRPAESSGPPPEGAAGFSFGASATRTGETCVRAGYRWELADGATYRCSGAPAGSGSSETASLVFCEERLCRIEVVMRPGKDWLGAFRSFQAALTRKYGGPAGTRNEFPDDCQDAAALPGCLERARARFEVDWLWASGEAIALTLGAGGGAAGGPALRIRYSVPGAFRPNGDAL